MKIALFFSGNSKYFNGFGGAERRISYIYDNLVYHECTIIFLSYSFSDEIDRYLRRYVKRSTIIHCQNQYEVFKLLCTRKFDYYCTVDNYFRSLIFTLMGKLKNGKTYMMIESSRKSVLNHRFWIYKYVFNFNIYINDYIDTLYPNSISILQNKYKNKNIRLTPPCLPLMHKFAPKQKEKIIVFASRLDKQKNPDLFLEVIYSKRKLIRDKGYKVLICGDGDLFKNLKEYIEQKQIGDICKLLGHKNMEDILPYSRIFFSLQTLTNYPSQSLLEAISSGNYCIVSNTGESHKLVNDNFGCLINLNIEDLSKALQSALEIDGWKQIEHAAVLFAKNNFNVEQSVKHYNDIFNRRF